MDIRSRPIHLSLRRRMRSAVTGEVPSSGLQRPKLAALGLAAEAWYFGTDQILEPSMNARELAERILLAIENGTLDPEAIVVRPFCMCDDAYGYVEARHLDQVVRRYEDVLEPARPVDSDGKPVAARIFKYGNVDPGPSTEKTLKLG